MASGCCFCLLMQYTARLEAVRGCAAAGFKMTLSSLSVEIQVDALNLQFADAHFRGFPGPRGAKAMVGRAGGSSLGA